ncbi:hypothetical protein V1264_013237 [Littorina saxatilis]|uniref:Uncharacterized protein n=1 Tax=Littorina saxatilis TaxID=31220 RepID=A0AAN9BPM1_9CAEN
MATKLKLVPSPPYVRVARIRQQSTSCRLVNTTVLRGTPPGQRRQRYKRSFTAPKDLERTARFALQSGLTI